MRLYHVSPDGDDANPGTIDSPWRTLSRVMATNFLPGDTVSFRRGGTWSGGLVIDDSGASGNPITFTAYGTGPRPVFTNPGGAGSRCPIEVRADWVIVEGFLVQGAYSGGVYVSAGSDHNVIRDIEATDVGVGIEIGGQHNLATGNYLHDLHMVVNTQGGNDDYGAIGILLNGSDNEVSYNRMVNCRASSYDWGVDGGAIELFGSADRNYCHHNWATTSEGFMEVGGGSAEDVVVAYNVSVNNGSFLYVHLSGSFASSVANFRVEHNTIVETATGNQGYEVIGFSAEPTSATVLVRNNVIWVERGSGQWGGLQRVSYSSGFTHENNIYQLIGGVRLDYDLGPGELLADPLFVDLAGGDFHLQSGSPAIDCGADLGYTRDFDDRPVPLGAAPDLGAFEHEP